MWLICKITVHCTNSVCCPALVQTTYHSSHYKPILLANLIWMFMSVLSACKLRTVKHEWQKWETSVSYTENPYFLPHVSAWLSHHCYSGDTLVLLLHSLSLGASQLSLIIIFFIPVCFICLFSPLFLYFCLSPGWLSEWVVGCVASSLTAVWEPSCHSRSSLVPLSFWSQSPLI